MSPNNFRFVRHALGLTQAQLAQRLGMSLISIKSMEGGRRPITRATVVRLRAAGAGESELSVFVPDPLLNLVGQRAAAAGSDVRTVVAAALATYLAPGPLGVAAMSGRQFRTLRMAVFATQEECAAFVGMNRTMITRYETGVLVVPRRMQLLMEALGRIRPSVASSRPMRRSDVVRARRRLGLTQRQLAGALGVSVSLVRAWEQDRRPVSAAAAMALRRLEKEKEGLTEGPRPLPC